MRLTYEGLKALNAIPFDQEVLEQQKKNIGLPVSASGVLNKTEQQILKYVLVQPDITAVKEMENGR